MPNPSNESKQRWNASHYTQMKFSIKPGLAAAFKEACAAADVSMTSVISEFMISYCQMPEKAKQPPDPFATRRLCRKFVNGAVRQFKELLVAEERRRDNTPENLRGSIWYEASEQSSDAIQEVIGLMEEIYS